MALSPIKLAAVQQNGKIWTGRNHAEIILAMHKQGCSRVMSNQQGFVDENGEFLSRRQAYVRAVQCGQVADVGPDHALLSEDLLRQ